jgi:hypothetical protein
VIYPPQKHSWPCCALFAGTSRFALGTHQNADFSRLAQSTAMKPLKYLEPGEEGC